MMTDAEVQLFSKWNPSQSYLLRSGSVSSSSESTWILVGLEGLLKSQNGI